MIIWRFFYLRAAYEREALKVKLERLKANPGGFDEFEKSVDEKLLGQMERTEEMIDVIRQCNEPGFLREEQAKKLDQIAGETYELNGTRHTLLNPRELENLAIQKGNLNKEERSHMESHVSLSYEFLKKIPWTVDLKNIPEYAYGHHEKLDGTGYPLGRKDGEINLVSKMIAIADIYDALVAPDRPYKRSLSREQTLDILREEAGNNHVDSELVQLFIRDQVYDVIPI